LNRKKQGLTTGFRLAQKAGAILDPFEMPWPAFCADDPELAAKG